MMWVFAILVVLAMGAVAMLAAGRGEPMRRAYDDRRDVVVPADRPLGAEDLRRVRFSLAFRGYRMAEVDALLARLVREMSPVPQPGADAPASEAATRRTEDQAEDQAEDRAEDQAEDQAGEDTPSTVRQNTHGR